MKKLMIAMAAVAMVGAAQAKAQYEYDYDAMVSHYAAKDTTPGNDHSGWYSFYAMTQDTAQDLLEASKTVTYQDVANWLGKNFAANKDEVIKESQALEYYYYVTDSKQYNWYGYELGEFAKRDTYIGVAFFDNGKDLAYNVLSESGYSFHFDDTNTSLSSGWLSVEVPEPTSGLLMLLGMAGLALKRRRA